MLSHQRFFLPLMPLFAKAFVNLISLVIKPHERNRT